MLCQELFSLEVWVSDVQALSRSYQSGSGILRNLFAPTLLSLTQLENRHRKTLAPLISRLTLVDTTEELGEGSSSMSSEERDVVRFAVNLRINSLTATEGREPSAKSISTEFERRE